ncbi:aminotransferases class-i pyridoxal-phosphate attachment site [Trichococcus palustris]|jgi:aminotransferase|uniref:Aminotransferase n=1 Tax=Trichococcus palustris TaxID=140314 RepID=A0A143YKJ9_9LACT|nr:pyridoxal phosphate-dependent aminotransferase [Trichococcus palustris]CZQ92882.1 aminotransferases class-i pyridoxal-phosphate attachment site [Trichococcus palustris]SFK85476.1 aminotransferase [Trichococcus palustris]
MYQWSELSKNFPASSIRKMAKLASEFDDTLMLTIGEPNFETPKFIKKAGQDAIAANRTHYGPNVGEADFQKAVAAKYTDQTGIPFQPNEVMATFGGTEGILHIMMTVLNTGDEVIIADPSYPNYLGQIMMLGATVVPVPVYEHNKFKMQAADIEKAITPKTKLIILNTPNNPLGSILDQKDIEDIVALADRHQITILSDEVYESLIYDGTKHFSLFQVPGAKENHFVVNSLSKTYAMTGWRIGYVVGNPQAIERMAEFREAIGFCVPPFVQEAAVAAITSSQAEVHYFLAEYDKRRHIIVDGLNKIPGFHCLKTEGAFYAFPNIKAFGKSSYDFAMEILLETHVALTPGSAFGKMGEGYLRISFAESEEVLQEAVDRIAAYIKKAYPHLLMK